MPGLRLRKVFRRKEEQEEQELVNWSRRSLVFNVARICCERSTAMSSGVCVCMLVVLLCVYESVSV